MTIILNPSKTAGIVQESTEVLQAVRAQNSATKVNSVSVDISGDSDDNYFYVVVTEQNARPTLSQFNAFRTRLLSNSHALEIEPEAEETLDIPSGYSAALKLKVNYREHNSLVNAVTSIELNELSSHYLIFLLQTDISVSDSTLETWMSDLVSQFAMIKGVHVAHGVSSFDTDTIEIKSHCKFYA